MKQTSFLHWRVTDILMEWDEFLAVPHHRPSGNLVYSTWRSQTNILMGWNEFLAVAYHRPAGNLVYSTRTWPTNRLMTRHWLHCTATDLLVVGVVGGRGGTAEGWVARGVVGGGPPPTVARRRGGQGGGRHRGRTLEIEITSPPLDMSQFIYRHTISKQKQVQISDIENVTISNQLHRVC